MSPLPSGSTRGQASQAPSPSANSSSPADLQPINLETVWQTTEALRNPTGLALAKDGSVVVVDYTADQVVRLSASDGTEVDRWGKRGSSPGEFDTAAGIAVDANGFAYVADHTNDRIQKFDATGAFVTSWGSHGDGQGQFDGPDGIAIGPDDLVYVSEDTASRVQVFDEDGGFRSAWKGPPSPTFGDPTGIAFASGRILVGDYDNNRIWVLDSKGAQVGVIGDPAVEGLIFRGVGQMTSDATGRLFAIDYNGGRILAFDGDRHVATYLMAGGQKFGRPWGIAVDPNGDLYVSEFSAGRVSRLRIPAQPD